jgi:plastocyanin
MKAVSPIARGIAVLLSISPVVTMAAAALTTAISYPAHAYDETGAVAGAGTITGQVVFHGTVPMKQIIPNKDVDVCGGPREEALIEVGPGGGVANALVYLADVPKGKNWPAAGKAPELDNVKCRFVPEIQVIRPGSIAVANKDPVLHNTHGYYGKRTAFNMALPNQDQTITTELLKTGTVRVDCDAHGWMEGWIYVRDNPYFVITGADGKFTIADIPPGNYTLVTLQPYSALIEQPVMVTTGKSPDLTIEIKAQPQ